MALCSSAFLGWACPEAALNILFGLSLQAARTGIVTTSSVLDCCLCCFRFCLDVLWLTLRLTWNYDCCVAQSTR